MAEYLPFQEKHSILEAQINILFLGTFDERSIEEARQFARAELSEELPRAAEGRGGSVRIDVTDPTSPALLETTQSDLMGFRLFRVQSDGQPARVLQLESNALSVSFMDYDSWEATKKDVVQYLRPVLASLPLEQNPVVAISLRFIDRYTYSGNPGDAGAERLFVKGNPYITQHSFEAGPTWHCNTGWFEDQPEEGDRVLQNLNVTSSLVDLSSAVTIDHQATRHLGSPRHTLDVLLEPPNGAVGLVAAQEILHDRNKRILGELLLPEMLAKIGM